MPSPRPLPKSASLLGPKSSSAMAIINRICHGENSPSPIDPPGSHSIAPSNPCGNSRLPSICSQRSGVKELNPFHGLHRAASLLYAVRSRPLDQPGNERGPAWQLRDQDVLVQGVSSVAYAAEPVQGWDSQTCCEITIGAAAHRGLAQLPSQFARDRSA